MPDEDIILKREVELKEIPQPKEEVPILYPMLTLSNEQKGEIVRGIKAELEAIKKERAALDLDSLWESYENQYWGIVAEAAWPYGTGSFSVHIHMTMKHCNMVENRVFQSYFESDPIYSVSPRPGLPTGKIKEAFETCEKIEDLLDYEMDTDMQIKSPVAKAIHSSVLLDGGILKLPFEYEEETVRDEEEYEGKKGAEEFIDEYGEDKYPGIIKALREGKTKRFRAKYKIPTYSAPKPSFVELKNFYVRTSTKGLPGLKTAKLIAEKQSYTWHELKQAEKEGKFDLDVEELKFIFDTEKEDVTIRSDYLSKDWTVWECTYLYALEGEEEERIVVWLVDFENSNELDKILGAITFPYWHNRPYYIPFFATDRGIPGCADGFYNSGLGRVLQPTNIVANAITKLTLDGAEMSNMLLFKVKEGSTAAVQLMSRRWMTGMPLEYQTNKDEIEKLDTKTGGLPDLITLGRINEKTADDTTGMSSGYLTGQADPTDPDAPAAKTMALIKESNINVKQYISKMLAPMNEIAYQSLQLFYQFRKDLSFQLKKSRVGEGKAVFANVSKAQLRLRTNIAANAYSFDFDKVMEKRENMALVQVLSQTPMFAELLSKNPKAVWALGDILIKSWSNMWNQKSDMIWPTQEQFKKDLIELQKEAFRQIVEEHKKRIAAQAAGRVPGAAGPGPMPPPGPQPMAAAPGGGI